MKSKTIKAPKRQEFTQLILQARKQAQKTELTKEDVLFAIKELKDIKS